MNLSSLYENPRGRYTRWFSFENPTGAKGAAATARNGRKGAACRAIAPGERVTLLKTDGPGVVRYFWIGVYRFNEVERMRKLRFEMYWDGAEEPAVNAPVGDFFCHAIDAEQKPFKSVLFTNPEGHSFNCMIPMPFKKSAEIVVINDSDENIEQFYYLIEATFGETLPEDMLYFHTIFSPERKTVMRQDFEVLPKVEGCGRFLGCNVQMYAGENYEGTWFGEGEIKVYIDGDDEYPTLAGTGTEDYIMTSWGQGEFYDLQAGCTLMKQDEQNRDKTAFYRFHITDPVWFHEDCRVTLQQIGSANAESARKTFERGAVMEKAYAITDVDLSKPMYDADYDLYDPELFFVGFEREDYLSAIAYFYLDRPTHC